MTEIDFYWFQGISRETIEAAATAKGIGEAAMKGQMTKELWNKAKPWIASMAKHIRGQKARIGGNFAVAHAVTTREMRDCVREVLPDCIFVTLTMTREAQKKRVFARHGKDAETFIKWLTDMYDLYELPAEDESNTYNVDITEEMTPTDVFNKVLEVLEKNTGAYNKTYGTGIKRTGAWWNLSLPKGNKYDS